MDLAAARVDDFRDRHLVLQTHRATAQDDVHSRLQLLNHVGLIGGFPRLLPGILGSLVHDRVISLDVGPLIGFNTNGPSGLWMTALISFSIIRSQR